MNVDSESINYPPTEGAVPSTANAPDIEMVAVSDSSSAKIVRNVQTQHGDYRVDTENIFLIPRCLWPDDDNEQSTSTAATSADKSAGASGSGNASGSGSSSGCVDQLPKEDTEQVVWIEPFANEVCLCLQSHFAVETILSTQNCRHTNTNNNNNNNVE